MDRWTTLPIDFKGGLVTNMPPIQQGIAMPGSATALRNFEPSVEGGYRRISGYTKWDPAQVTGSAAEVRGVHEYKNEVYAAVGSHLYKSAGSGWTQITDNATYSSAGVTLSGTGKVRFAKHLFGSTKVLIVTDGTSKPYKFDGTTFSQITTAPSDLIGAKHVTVFKDHLFFSVDNTLISSVPYDDSNYDAALGGWITSYGDEITGLVPFRESLMVLTKRTIFAISGYSYSDFTSQPVTRDVGCPYHDTAQELGGDVMFLSPDGLRLLSATERNNDFGLGVVSKVIQSEMTSFMELSTQFSSLVIRGKSQYRVLGSENNTARANAPGIIAVQYSQQGGDNMAFAETRGIFARVSHSELLEEGELVIFANNDGYVYQMENGRTFDGAGIIARFDTPNLALSDPETRKTLYKCTLYAKQQGDFEAVMSTIYDFQQAGAVQPPSTTFNNVGSEASYYGTATYGTSTYGAATTRYTITQQLTGSGYTVQFRFESTDDSAPYNLDTLTIQYGQYGRR